jgi:hypothetical protein
MVPETRCVRSGDVDIAFQVFGSGPRNLLALSGYRSHLEVVWEPPGFARFLERLGSIGRVPTFDKRGTKPRASPTMHACWRGCGGWNVSRRRRMSPPR